MDCGYSFSVEVRINELRNPSHTRVGLVCKWFEELSRDSMTNCNSIQSLPLCVGVYAKFRTSNTNYTWILIYHNISPVVQGIYYNITPVFRKAGSPVLWWIIAQLFLGLYTVTCPFFGPIIPLYFFIFSKITSHFY